MNYEMKKKYLKKGIYRAVFSDIDGTLLTTKHQILPRTKKKIQDMTGKGIPFVLVSARMPEGMAFIRDELGKPEPMICYSGALVVDADGKPIYSTCLPEEEIQAMYQYIKTEEPEVSMNLYAEDSWIVETREDPWVQQEMSITGTVPEEADFSNKTIFRDIHKVLCMGEPEQIFRLEQTLQTKFPDIRIYRSKDTYLEIISMKASKSDAVRQLGEHFGVRREEILAFGDGYNDIDMLKYAGLGVAMGNADREVQLVSDLVTATNDEEGLRQVLDQVF